MFFVRFIAVALCLCFRTFRRIRRNRVGPLSETGYVVCVKPWLQSGECARWLRRSDYWLLPGYNWFSCWYQSTYVISWLHDLLEMIVCCLLLCKKNESRTSQTALGCLCLPLIRQVPIRYCRHRNLLFCITHACLVVTDILSATTTKSGSLPVVSGILWHTRFILLIFSYIMYRNTYPLVLISNSTSDCLPDPLSGVSWKPEITRVVKFIHRCQESDIALLNEIKQIKATYVLLIFLGHPNY